MDDPFTDIDLFRFKSIEVILKTYKKDKIIILSTHITKIAFELSDKIIYLDKESAKCYNNDFESDSDLEDYIWKEMSKDR